MRFLNVAAGALMLAAVLAGARDAGAQQAAPAAGTVATALPDRIIRPMRAIDAITLRAEGVTIRLWGIKPAQSSNTALEMRALDMLEGLLQEQQINCKIVGGAMPDLWGRCATQSNQDLALELLGNGFAVVDRRQTYDSVFATAYEKAQENARVQNLGVWDILQREKTAADLPAWVQDRGILLAIAAGVPLFGFLVMSGFLWNLARQVKGARSGNDPEAQMKEALLQARERSILISVLEGELSENKNKAEAFLVIYRDMLRVLREGTETPKYQQVGDIVQKNPAFSRAAFEANVGKLSLLDIQLAGHISKIYAAMPRETEYINLDQSVPLDTAVKLVEKVVQEAERIAEPLSRVIAEIEAAAAAERGG
jgi:endonuclease YncB( thermonuclease family)